MHTGTPQGFRDILPTEALARERITATVRKVFSAHGYLPVETPLIEERDLLLLGGRVQDSPFQLFDSDGSLLMARPDLTLPIARLVAARMGADDLPVRLRYAAPVVREESSLKGQPRQFTQLGVEYFGEGAGVAAEVEVAGLLAETLEALEVPAWRLVLGSVVPLTALLDCCVAQDELRGRILSFVHQSDFVSLDEVVAAAGLPENVARAICGVPRVAGGPEAIDRIDALLQEAGVPSGRRGTSELREFVSALSPLARSGRLRLDFSVIGSFDYYTGIILKCYAEGITAAIASGGRYDALLENLGRPGVAACGFALSLDRLQEILGEQGESGVVSSDLRLGERPLRVAVPKGSLFSESVRLLRAAGLPVEGLRQPGRRLIIREGDVEYVIVRAQDAPTFVAHGGADCGICGYDSIFEANHDLVQLADLGFGACRFVVAEPRSKAGAAEEAYRWRGTVRVATKYPRVTQSYYDRIGQQVDIVQLHGNIELGPIVGMTDRIVDITATGATLVENDLVIVDEVMKCTARFFAGPAAYRNDHRVRELAERLAALAPGGKGES